MFHHEQDLTMSLLGIFLKYINTAMKKKILGAK